MRLRMADVLPSAISMLVIVLQLWIGTRALQLLGQRWPVFLLGGLIPPSS
jgi:hypothetical protein